MVMVVVEIEVLIVVGIFDVVVEIIDFVGDGNYYVVKVVVVSFVGQFCIVWIKVVYVVFGGWMGGEFYVL